ncbi:MAG: hypothetical protein JSU87_04345 [Gemmatimonadota bacterium]|nr:MAG: hypothetical protein JSU87_04345 [Gemmatimonadota bacterium]
MPTEPSQTRYIIQLDLTGEKPDIEAVRELLRDAEIELDESYGPILVNPSQGRYVVRGTASPEARERAERIPGVRFFADVRQEPTSASQGEGRGPTSGRKKKR